MKQTPGQTIFTWTIYPSGKYPLSNLSKEWKIQPTCKTPTIGPLQRNVEKKTIKIIVVNSKIITKITIKYYLCCTIKIVNRAILSPKFAINCQGVTCCPRLSTQITSNGVGVIYDMVINLQHCNLHCLTSVTENTYHLHCKLWFTSQLVSATGPMHNLESQSKIDSRVSFPISFILSFNTSLSIF